MPPQKQSNDDNDEDKGDNVNDAFMEVRCRTRERPGRDTSLLCFENQFKLITFIYLLTTSHLQDSQETHTQLIELTQLTQPDHLTPDESSNLMSASSQTPLSPPPVLPWGRLVPCDLAGRQQPLEFLSDQLEYLVGRSSKCDLKASAITVESNPALTEKEQKIFAWGHSLISNHHCRIFLDRIGSHENAGPFGSTSSTANNNKNNNSSFNRFSGDGSVYIEDMSGNGTIINQQTQLRKGEKRMLHSGDEICLIDANILRKRVSSERIIQMVLSAYSFTFIQSKPRKPCVDPRAMNYQRNFHRQWGGLAGGIANINPHNNAISKTRSFSLSLSSPPNSEQRIELVYDIREVLGDGTSGQVRRCIHRKSGQEYAVKVIGLRRQFDMSMMEREVSLLQSLDHPYIVQLIDVFVKPGDAMYIVMELVKGGDLFDKICNKGKYSELEARRAMRRLLTAVFYLHEHCNIVHRDLKPENILCSSIVNIKLADFGLAKIVKSDGLKTFCGTPAYFAPEVLKRRGTVAGEGRYGKPADMWSLGVILYILLVGKPPFDADMDDPKTFELELGVDDPICDFPMARDLVQQLLRQDPKRRLTIRQACCHPWINTDDGDTHCHPLDDPAVTTKKRLFHEKLDNEGMAAASEDHDASSNSSVDLDDESVRSKDSVLSKEEFAQAAISHIRTDSVFHFDSSTLPSPEDARTQSGVRAKKEDQLFERARSSHNPKVLAGADSPLGEGKEKRVLMADRPDSPSPRDLAKQMSIDSGRAINPADDLKQRASSTPGEEMNHRDMTDVTPSENSPSPPRSPLSKLNVNDRGNRFRDEVLQSQSNRERAESPDAAPLEEDTETGVSSGKTCQTAVTPTSSNVRKQPPPERDEANGRVADETVYADEVDDPILSQFSSEPSSIDSFGESCDSSTEDSTARTSLVPAQISGDKKRRMPAPEDDTESSEMETKDSVPAAKRPRTDDSIASGSSKSKQTKQTTLMNFFVAIKKP